MSVPITIDGIEVAPESIRVEWPAIDPPSDVPQRYKRYPQSLTVSFTIEGEDVRRVEQYLAQVGPR